MEIPKNRYRNTSDFQGESGNATVNLSQLSLFVDNMISNYNFPELATFREWVSNAHDSHVASGQTRPVEVVLPSQLQPTFSVQDYGIGMSADDVKEVYLDFGSSTKRDDNTGIGGFGIGGKSALAIASQYTMSAVKDGLKNIFIFERSPAGGVGFKRVIEDAPTDEPNSVLVQVSVDRPEQFSEQNVNRVLAGWSNSQVKIMNRPDGFFSIPDSGIKTEFTVDVTDLTSAEGQTELDIRNVGGYVLNGALDPFDTGQTISKKLGLGWREFAVLVGPVVYTFEPNIARSALAEYMVASVNIGDVTFPSSREVIEPNRRNREFVGTVFNKLVEEADALMQKRADELTTRREALALHRSPLARNRYDFKVKFQGESIPTTFEKAADDGIYEYRSVGNWQGIKNYQLSAIPFNSDNKYSLDIETLVILDSEITEQSVRNATRLLHTDREDKPADLKGYLYITKNPSEWAKAAAKTVITSTELTAKAKEIRQAIRDGKIAPSANAVATPRRSRRDRIGEYTAHYLDFSTDADGKLSVEEKYSDLIDFYDDVFDPKKTLVLTTASKDGMDANAFIPYFQAFNVNPDDAQFLYIATSSKIETLRILLGDEVEITDTVTWMKNNFADQAQYSHRNPEDIVKELPLRLSHSDHTLLEYAGLSELHPKMQEIVALNKELDESMQIVNGWSSAARIVREIMGFDQSSVNMSATSRPEFFFLTNTSYYGRGISDDYKPAVRQMINNMVELWLANVAAEKQAESDKAALEEAEADDAFSSSADNKIPAYAN